MNLKLNKSEDQQKFMKAVQQAIRTTIENNFDNAVARFIESSITVEQLFPQGLKLSFKVVAQVSPLDVKPQAQTDSETKPPSTKA